MMTFPMESHIFAMFQTTNQLILWDYQPATFDSWLPG
jgi:hypothetical protein